MPDSPSSVNEVPRKKLGFLRPCDTIQRNKPDDTILLPESFLIKPCDTIPAKKPEDETKLGQMMLLKPCTTIPTSSTKKRRLDQSEVVVEEPQEFPSIEIKRGQPVDLIALLSSKARDYLVSPKDGQMVPVSSLVGKYVLVCCFYVPFDVDSPEAGTCQSLEALYSHLFQQGIVDDVKLVVVVMLDSGFNSEVAFDTFFSTLSVNCLAIPFSDHESRHYVCYSLGYSPNTRHFEEIPYLAVNPSGIVLKLDPHFLNDYGALAFPFTQDHLLSIYRQEEIIKLRFRSSDPPITLDELLQCGHVSRISDENKSTPTSGFRETPVGIYLYYDGAFMDKLQDIHKKCLVKDLKFEIVLVPLPFERYCDPASFYNIVKQRALKDCRSSSWWAFPFNENVCRTLWRYFYHFEEDQLIILPHGDCLGDLCGKYVASNYGIDAYPFTRDVVVERKVNELRSLTLAHLLGDTFFCNKNVLLYLDYAAECSGDGYIYKTLDKDSNHIRLKYPGTEVIFVSLKHDPDSEHSSWMNFSWHMATPEMCKSVIKHIFMQETYLAEHVIPTLAAFGKDGKILSRCAHERLPISTASESLFDDTLRTEILDEMEKEM